MMMKAYTVLGVAPGATVAEIKAAYRERARQIHPDRFADDPRRAQQAHEAFVELSAAFRAALAASSATAAASAAAAAAADQSAAARSAAAPASGPRIPPQRRSAPQQRQAPATPAAPRPASRGPAQRPAQGSAQGPAQRPTQPPTVAPIRQSDPMLTLLTVPQRCARPWSAHSLEVWALTVIPEARRHLAEAKRVARASGVSTERHLTTAAAHALLTLTVNGLNGPRVMGVAANLDAAYDALEIVLPRSVVDRLPARVTARRPVGEEVTTEPGRRLLAFCAASGALAAATVWTHFFGFFAG